MKVEQNLSLKCVDCGITFKWTAAQQQAFAARNLMRPKRCASCRRAKREQAQESTTPGSRKRKQ